jgi:DNA-binding transcriptional MerR regulator
VPPKRRLLLTAELAAELGVSARLIQQYRQEGTLTPAMETPKGHARWDLEDVMEQLKQLREDRAATPDPENDS